MFRETARIAALLAVAVLLAAQAALPAEKAVEIPADAREIVGRGTYCRWHVYLAKPSIGPVGDAAKQKPLKGREKYPPYRHIDRLSSPQAPDGWQQPDFDDAGWQRAKPGEFGVQAFSRYSSHTFRMRSRFVVSDPKAVTGLFVSLSFRGGAIVYLNGKEVAREHLPAGKLEPGALAEAYPEGVFFDAKGQPIPSSYNVGKLPAAAKADCQARIKRRSRSIGPLKLPLETLRKGVNVLAVELRRSPYTPPVAKWFGGKSNRTRPNWKLIGTRGPSLSATGSGIVPNSSRPAGLQVWTEDRNVRLSLGDYGATASDLLPLRIVAARNGTFCAQFAVGSDAAIKGLAVKVGALKTADGKAEFPTTGLELLSARANVVFYGKAPWFDALRAGVPAEVSVSKRYKGALLPIIVRATIPKDFVAGTYKGTIEVTAGGAKPVKVPISVEVSDWVIPAPRDYRTYIGIYQSPTSVALQYKVKMWSPEHWKLLEKSFALLARAGNKMINVPVVDHTQFGNEEGFITWIKQEDGSYDHDLGVFEKYLDLALKHCGSLDHVALQIWHAAGWKARGVDQPNTVRVRDAKTGKISHLQVPRFDSAEARKFWKPLFDKVKASLAKRKLEKTLCVGILSDSTAPAAVFKMFDEVLPPKALWHRGCHVHNGTGSMKPYGLKGGGLVVLHEHCYGLNMANPDKPLPAFWNLRGQPGTAYDRISNHERYMSLAWYRNTAMLSLFRRKKGVGRICLDFWPVLKDKRGRGKWIYNRYPESSCGQRRPSMQKMTWPGKSGAQTTICYETFLEGIQDAEAVIVVSEAIDKHGEKIGAELKAECQKVLVDLLRYQTFGRDRAPTRPVHYGWQDCSRRLYECAAKVSAKLK
jgi:Glycoside hydrolase 123, catalytic domain